MRYSRSRRRYGRRRRYGGRRGVRGVGGGVGMVRTRRVYPSQTKNRVIAAGIAGMYGMMERPNDSGKSSIDFIPALFDDRAHTVALVSAVGAMMTRGSLRKGLDHVANAMVPVSAYKLGRKGFDPEGDGILIEED